MADRSGFSRIVGSLGRSYVVRHPRSTCTWWTRIWIEFCCICCDIYILLHLFWHLQIVRNPGLFGYARTKTVSHVLRQKRFTNICIVALIDFSKRRFMEEWKSAKIEKKRAGGGGGGGSRARLLLSSRVSLLVIFVELTRTSFLHRRTTSISLCPAADSRTEQVSFYLSFNFYLQLTNNSVGSLCINHNINTHPQHIVISCG